MAPASMTTNDDDRPPISLAAERKQRERDFTAERAELLQELKDIGVEELRPKMRVCSAFKSSDLPGTASTQV